MSLYPRIDGQTAEDASSGTQLTLAAMNIAAGDLLVGFCGWYGTDTQATVAEIGGTNGFTMAARTNMGNAYAQMCYRIAAEADATAEFRMTLGSGATYRSFGVIQFRPDTGEVIIYDAGPSAAADGTSPHTSGTITTTGTDEVIVGSIYFAAARTPTVFLVAGSGSDSRYPASGAASGFLWYKFFSSAQASKTVQVYQSGGDVDATINLLAFKSVAVQYARPNSDIADGGWTNQNANNVNLYDSVNEETPSDADYARSGATPVNDTVEWGLSSVGTPDAGGDIIIKVRARVV